MILMDKVTKDKISIKRPMLVISAFVTGAAALCALGAPLWATLAAALATCIILAFVRKSAAVPLTAALLAVFTALSYTSAEKRANALAERYDGVETEITGVVRDRPQIYENREVCVIKTKDLGLVQLTRYGARADTPSAGDRVCLRVTLSAPKSAKNGYGFDNRSYLYSRKIYLAATDEGPMKIESGGVTPMSLAARAQSAAVRTGERLLRGDALGLYCAVVFGDKRHTDAELKTALTASGLSHIASVSGLHLSIVSVVLLTLLSLLFGRGRAGLAAAICGAVAFTLVTGASSATVRACIMTTLYLTAKLLYRDSDGLSSLGAAVSAMLLYNPMLILGASFQLSALATLGILMFVPLWQPRLAALPMVFRAPAELVLVSLAAQIGAFAALAAHYNGFALYFIPANLIVVPPLSIALPMGLMLPLLGRIPLLGGLWARLCEALFGFIALTAKRIAALPFSIVSLGRPSAPLIVSYAALVLTLYLICTKRRAMAAAFAVCAVLAGGAGGLMIHAENSRATLTFLDVGRGDCAVFCLPGGKTVLIDGGKSGHEIRDFLEGRGVARVDAAVVTSASREHIGGIISLASDGMIETLCLPKSIVAGPEAAELLAEAAENGVRTATLGDGLYVASLRLRPAGENDGTAIMAEYGGCKILFCADGYTEWEPCAIVKAPNHGVGKYNYINEINRSHPSFAVISGLKSARERCAYLAPLLNSGAEVRITGEGGAAVFDLSGAEPTMIK